MAIIKHTRKSLLFHQDRAWSKRNSDNTFDVTMGSYDGAEVCELIGLFILDTLQDRFGKDVGLYRNDGLAVINTRSGRLCDKERKELTAVFDNLGLKITALNNQLRTNFLDLTFDLNNGSYKPYRKPNDNPLYINQSSNHPPPQSYASYPIPSTDESIPCAAIKKLSTKQPPHTMTPWREATLTHN